MILKIQGGVEREKKWEREQEKGKDFLIFWITNLPILIRFFIIHTEHNTSDTIQIGIEVIS